MARKIFRGLCATAAIAGFAVILGTAGGSDCGLLTMKQISIQCSIGLALFGGGLWLGGWLK